MLDHLSLSSGLLSTVALFSFLSLYIFTRISTFLWRSVWLGLSQGEKIFVMCYMIRVSDRTILSPIVCVCYRRSSSFFCCCSFFASWFPYIPQYCPTFYVLLFFAPTSLHSPSAPIIQMYQWVLNSLLPPSPPWPRSIHHYHTLLFETSLSLILSQLFLPSIVPPYTLLSSPQ